MIFVKAAKHRRLADQTMSRIVCSVHSPSTCLFKAGVGVEYVKKILLIVL